MIDIIEDFELQIENLNATIEAYHDVLANGISDKTFSKEMVALRKKLITDIINSDLGNKTVTINLNKSIQTCIEI